MKGMKGLVLATAAAALLASGFVATATTKDSAEVKCMGVNKCKGTGKCKNLPNPVQKLRELLCMKKLKANS
jgi:hypothetical protein